MTATEADIARRAGAMCIAAEPHEDKTEWPCRKHLAEAARQFSIHPSALALAGVTDGPASIVAPASGAAGQVPAVPASVAPPSVKSNRPPALNEGPAEGATAIARTEGT